MGQSRAQSGGALTKRGHSGDGICRGSGGLSMDDHGEIPPRTHASNSSGARAVVCGQYRLYHKWAQWVCDLGSWIGCVASMESVTPAATRNYTRTLTGCHTCILNVPAYARQDRPWRGPMDTRIRIDHSHLDGH